MTKDLLINSTYRVTKKTARVSTYGHLSHQTKYLWIALHGSKMLCEQMLYKFDGFDPDTHFVVAPEALNRFYADGFGGDVVASWMTKRDRLHEIEDLTHYLNELLADYSQQVSSDCKKIVLAFSQGGTMAHRWLHRYSVNIDYLIAYSCWIPEEIDLKASSSSFSNINCIYTYGIQDPFLTEKRIQMIKAILKQNELPHKFESYEGDHRVSKEQLQYLFNRYISSPE